MRVRDSEAVRLYVAASFEQTMLRQGERALSAVDDRQYPAAFEYGRRNVNQFMMQAQRN